MSDPVLERRIRIAKMVKHCKRLGYTLFLLAMVLFFIGLASEFSETMATIVTACLIGGSIILAPAIIMGYAVRSAHREDHELGRL